MTLEILATFMPIFKQVTDKKNYLYRATMQALEDELNPSEFLRIHRSYFINTRYVQTCRYLNNNEYKFTLKNQKEFISGRAYKPKIIQYLENQNSWSHKSPFITIPFLSFFMENNLRLHQNIYFHD